MAVHIFLGLGEEGGEALGGVVEAGHVVRSLRREARSVVPTDRDAGEDRDVEDFVHLLADLDGLFALEKVVRIETAHVVEGLAVDSEGVNVLLHSCHPGFAHP